MDHDAMAASENTAESLLPVERQAADVDKEHEVVINRVVITDTAAHDDPDGASSTASESLLPILRHVALVVMPVFMGYGVLLSLQERLRKFIGITDNKSHDAHVFQSGVSLIFVGDLIFRLMHNVFLSYLRPRQRVIFAYCCVSLSMALLTIIYYFAHSRNLAWVYVCYFIGGVGIGTYETNIVSCITPLGHGTKQWALFGMPLGYNGISIGAFLLFQAAPTSVALEKAVFIAVCVFNLAAAVAFIFTIPDVRYEASNDTALRFVSAFRDHWREWLPLVWNFLAAMLVNMFGVILMTGVVLYIFKADEVPIVPHSDTKVPKDTFQAIYNACAFCGDFSSRRFIYWYEKPINPFLLLILLAIGLALGLCHVAVLAWPGMFLVMFCNGSLYATTNRHVDDNIPRQFNLVVFSLWLFVGDCGSFAASYTTDYIAAAVAGS